MKRMRLFWLIGYVLLVFTLSTRPGLRAPGPEFHSQDKVAHATEYAIMGLLLYRAFGRSVGNSKAATFLFLVALGATIGAVDEMLQYHTPERQMDVFDWAADAAGVSITSAVCLARARRARGKGGDA